MVETITASDVALEVGATIGESPIWDARDGSLVFVDGRESRVHRFNPDSGLHTWFDTGEMVGAAGLRTDDGYVLALADGLYLADADGGGIRRAAALTLDPNVVRFNDAKVDPWGRFVAGTTDVARFRQGSKDSTQQYDPDAVADTGELPKAGLFALTPNGQVDLLVRGLTLANGLEWTADARTLYFIDSATYAVDAFDLDPETGNPRERRRVLVSDPKHGLLDGMTVDEEGCLWVALFRGGRVCRYRPTGELDRVVVLPTSNPTSVTFGGPDLRHLFITTARRSLTEHQLATESHAGDVFVVEVDVGGYPPHRFGPPGDVR